MVCFSSYQHKLKILSVETPDKSEILRYLMEVWKNLACSLKKDKKFNTQIIENNNWFTEQQMFYREIIGTGYISNIFS